MSNKFVLGQREQGVQHLGVGGPRLLEAPTWMKTYVQHATHIVYTYTYISARLDFLV